MSIIPWLNFVRKHVPALLLKRLPQEVVVISVGEAESKKLNYCYREKNKPANVLSFRYGNDYGEILMCPDVIRREARQDGVPYKYQMTKMIVHAMVHLAGIHHEASRAVAQKSKKLEQQIMGRLFGSLKIPNSKHQITNKF